MGQTAYYPNEIYTTFAFFGFLFAIIPLPWHLQAWNTGTCLFMFWGAISALNMFINSIIWHHNAINSAPIWCDISSRIILGTNIGISASLLCINRRLYHIASIKTVTISRAEKRRGVMIDLAIGLGIPIIDVILSYIPQGHRFNIFEDIGCFPAIYYTPVGLVLVAMMPFFITFISGIYSILAVRAFWKTRSQFDRIAASHSSCNRNRYLRLMALGAYEVLVNLPLSIQNFVLTIQNGIPPWLGWADTHSNFSRVDQFPRILWSMNGTQLELSRWLLILCPYIFFLFFGFAEEAQKNYRFAYQTVTKHTGLSSIGTWGNSGTFFGSRGSSTQVNTSSGTLPVYVKRDVHRKRDTLDSISDMTTSISDGASFDEKIHDEKHGVPDYDNIVLPVAGGSLDNIQAADEPHSPISSTSSSNSSCASLPLAVPQPHTPRPDSAVIEISSIHEDAPFKVSDKDSRV